MPSWKKTFYAAWAAQFLSMTGFLFVLPFMPLYIQQELGVSDTGEAIKWAGICTAATALMMAASSPVWGMLADRFGRKPMVLRAMFSGSVVLLLMGFAQNVTQLLILRALQGLLTGTVTASTALVASVAPRRQSGRVLGMMQAAVFVGVCVGPLFGGAVAEYLGHRAAFVVAGALLLVGGLVVKVAAQEGFVPVKAIHKSARGTFGQVFAAAGFAAVAFVFFTVRFGNNAPAPVFPVLVRSILGREEGARVLTGWILAGAGLAAAASSSMLGRLSDELGYRRVLVLFTFLTAVVSVAHVTADTVPELFVLRILFGFCAGGTIPAANAIVRHIIDDRNIGKAYGAINSLAALGMGLGPLVGGYLAGSMGLRAPFVLAGGVLALATLVVLWRVHPVTQPFPQKPEDEALPSYPSGASSPAVEREAPR